MDNITLSKKLKSLSIGELTKYVRSLITIDEFNYTEYKKEKIEKLVKEHYDFLKADNSEISWEELMEETKKFRDKISTNKGLARYSEIMANLYYKYKDIYLILSYQTVQGVVSENVRDNKANQETIFNLLLDRTDNIMPIGISAEEEQRIIDVRQNMLNSIQKRTPIDRFKLAQVAKDKFR